MRLRTPDLSDSPSRKLPSLKVITHHLGAMAPYFEARIGLGMDQMGARTSDEDYGALLKRLGKRPLDYFRMFYGDTDRNSTRLNSSH